MTINTDYAQLQAYGQNSHKDIKNSETKPITEWPALVKKDTIRPHWHSRLKAKAKL